LTLTISDILDCLLSAAGVEVEADRMLSQDLDMGLIGCWGTERREGVGVNMNDGFGLELISASRCSYPIVVCSLEQDLV